MAKLLAFLLTTFLCMSTHAACTQTPPEARELFLRGSMNNWAALDDYRFRWHCDAWALNLDLKGRHEFKIADADWTPATVVAADAKGQPSSGGQGNLVQEFKGAHTLRLRFDAQGRPQLQLGPKNLPDPKPLVITDKTALSLRFDSRNEESKSPFGAQPVGTEMRFNVTSDVPGLRAVTLVVERRRLEGNQEVLHYEPLARIEMTPHPHGLGSRFEGRYRFDAHAIYGYWFEVETAQGRYALQNNKDSVYWTREQGSMGLAVVEPLPENLKRVRRYRQTIHLADLRVPEWSADIVYYYIFPERFRNGDKSNDPRAGQARYQDQDVERHARWLENPHRPGVSGDAVFNNDFFGGDLAGVIEKLDEIKALGANTIYMTPVFQAASNHKYDTADYLRIDPGFGTNADFRRLCEKAAKRGLRVIPDTSLNHVGADSRYFDRFGNFGAKDGAFAGGKAQSSSPYAAWFKLDPSKSKPEDQYVGWVGVKDLPEIDKGSESFRRFAYRDPDSVTRHWLREGSAGWRMDVAPWVPDDFWREWSAVVKAEKRDALTVAETWFDSSKYFLGDQFDSTMNYIFRGAVLDYAAGKKASQIYPSLELTREAYPEPMLLANMNLLSTHDQSRALHVFGIAGNPHTDPGIDPAKLAEAKQRLLLGLLFQIGFPGAPTVYYGDEVGVGGGDDPFNRATYPWPDEGGQPDLKLRAEFKRLIALRHAHPVLRRGRLEAPLVMGDALLVLSRQLGDTQALIAMNNARQSGRTTLDLAPGSRWTDALHPGQSFQADAQGRLPLDIPPLFGRLLISTP